MRRVHGVWFSSVVALALGCGDDQRCGWDGPEGCLPGAETVVLAEWSLLTTQTDALLAVQNDDVLMLTRSELRRIAKDGSHDTLEATPEAGYRFMHLVADGAELYFVETNQDDLPLGGLLDVRVRRVDPDGAAPVTQVSYAAPAHGLAVEGHAAVTWFCYGGGCLLDVLDFGAGTRAEVDLDARPVNDPRAVLHAGMLDMLTTERNSPTGTDVSIALTRFDAATGAVVASFPLGNTVGTSFVSVDSGPTRVGDTVYVSATPVLNEERIYTYPLGAPEAVVLLDDDPQDGTAWRAGAEVVAGDEQGVFFNGFFEHQREERQLEAWFGVARYDAPSRGYVEVIDGNYINEPTLAVDATHLFVTYLERVCTRTGESCNNDQATTRQLVRVSR